MYTKFTYAVMTSIAVAAMGCATVSNANGNSDSTPRNSLLAGYSGQGYCSVEQNGDQVKASVKVINLTPGSTATAWLKFDGSTVGRLDGTVADASGSAVFSRTFSVDSTVSSFLFDVRDHNRQFSTIVDDADLTAELNQPSNVLTGESIRMGTCSFDNLNHANTLATTSITNAYAGLCLDTLGVDVNSSVYKTSCTGATHQQWVLKPSANYFEIVNADSNLCLDVNNSSTSLNSEVGQWTCTQNSNQLWDVQPYGSDFVIQSASSGMCLEVVGSGNAYQYNCDGYVGQRWQLTKP